MFALLLKDDVHSLIINYFGSHFHPFAMTFLGFHPFVQWTSSLTEKIIRARGREEDPHLRKSPLKQQHPVQLSSYRFYSHLKSVAHSPHLVGVSLLFLFLFLPPWVQLIEFKAVSLRNLQTIPPRLISSKLNIYVVGYAHFQFNSAINFLPSISLHTLWALL